MPNSPTPSFGLSTVEDYWPKRLLRVTDLTSYPRESGDAPVKYAFDINPRYNIISYHWGRYQTGDDKGTAIDIRGVSWEIPRIKPVLENELLGNGLSKDGLHAGGFDSEEFKAVLAIVGKDASFVWVDVACVPQCVSGQLGREADEEIGHQAAIFAKAHKAYVWLHSLSTEQLNAGIESLYYGDDVSGAARLFDDPWFTSLWTMQEAFFRNDAILLSRSGEQAECSWSSSTATVATIASLMHDFVHRGTRVIYNNFRYIGVETLASRNPLVLVAGIKYRNASRPTDQICGVMQAFGLHLDRNLGLESLITEFGNQIIQRFPVISQAFTHTMPECDPSWRIKILTPQDFSGGKPSHPNRDPRSMYDHIKAVPRDFYDMEEIPWPDCAKITYEDNCVMIFEGRVIRLPKMLKMLEDSQPVVRSAPPRTVFPRSDAREFEDDTPMYQELYGMYTNSPHCSVHLDKGIYDGSNPYQPAQRDPLNIPPADPIKEFRRLASGKASGRILVMGKFRSQGQEGYLGTIVKRFRLVGEDGGSDVVRRIGFCTWNVEPKDDPITQMAVH